MDQSSQYTTSLGLAKRALEYIASYNTPPTPHAYEVFYTVCAGLNPKLNEAVAKRVSEAQKITANDAEELHREYVSKEPPSEQMQDIGAKMTGEMSTLISMIAAAAASANTYKASLQTAEERLNGAANGQEVSNLVKSLLSATDEMRRTNAEVSSNLETSRAQMEQLEDCLKLVREESSRDSLTGLVNRKQFDILLDEAIIKSHRSGQPLCVLMIDIDYFKAFNDTHGHIAGDSALRYVASCIKSNIKGNETAARYGGEEFVVILPNTTIEYAVSLAERIRHLVHSRNLVKKATGENMGRVSVSIGVAEAVDSDSVDSLVDRADQCMYLAKRNGRNRVQSVPPGQELRAVEAVAGAA